MDTVASRKLFFFPNSTNWLNKEHISALMALLGYIDVLISWLTKANYITACRNAWNANRSIKCILPRPFLFTGLPERGGGAKHFYYPILLGNVMHPLYFQLPILYWFIVPMRWSFNQEDLCLRSCIKFCILIRDRNQEAAPTELWILLNNPNVLPDASFHDERSQRWVVTSIKC